MEQVAGANECSRAKSGFTRQVSFTPLCRWQGSDKKQNLSSFDGSLDGIEHDRILRATSPLRALHDHDSGQHQHNSYTLNRMKNFSEESGGQHDGNDWFEKTCDEGACLLSVVQGGAGRRRGAT